MNAQIICETLGGKPIGQDRYIARCPAHDDKSPSLSITQKDRVLVYCHSGCTQEQVISALRNRGLWYETTRKAPKFSESELDESMSFCVIWNSHIRRGKSVSRVDDDKMNMHLRRLKEHSIWRYRAVVEDACGD